LLFVFRRGMVKDASVRARQFIADALGEASTCGVSEIPVRVTYRGRFGLFHFLK
jgi:hypothetical protein